MPTTLTSSFASAAAGQSIREPRGPGRAGGTGEWTRKDSSRLTLRRSTATSNGPSGPSSAHPDNATSAEDAFASYSSNVPVDTRYSKENIIGIFNNMPKTKAGAEDSVKRLYVNNWNPEQSNGSTGRGWGKGADARDASNGPEVCWDQSGEVKPISPEGMSEAEKAVFASDVNSPLKPPPQINKETGTPGPSTNGRRNSLSQGGVAGYGLSSPTPGRPGNRRRETSDYLGASSVASPAGLGRFNRDESSLFFRKAADRDDDEAPPSSRPALPFGGLARSSTTGAPNSPWSAGPATTTMGAFGSFALPTGPGTPSKERPTFGRGESRLAHLMPKESSEDLGAPPAREPLRSDAAKSWRAKTFAAEADPFDEAPVQGGSASLGGQDLSPPMPQRRVPGYGTPSRQASRQTSLSDLQGFRDITSGQVSGTQTPFGRHAGQRDVDSPTETNPYASPAEDRIRDDASNNGSVGSSALHHQNQLRGIGSLGDQPGGAFGGMSRGFPSASFDHPDRSATSSAAGNKGFPSLNTLGGLSNLGGWPTSGNPIGTPDRERSFQSAFGNSIFGPMGAESLASPGGSLSGLGGFGATGGLAGSSTIGRGSKLGSLFPAAMQAQMHNNENDHQDDQRGGGAFGSIGRSAFGPPRETDSPLRSNRGIFDDILNGSDFRSGSAFGDGQQTPGGSAFAQIPGQAFQQNQTSGAPTPTLGSSLPTAQQRTMVMPDRMRWVYLDPQGQVQGPWSGLEMHDWYKASFFTPDLSVKKLEDDEFEPLGQLIRRIGNSREPFLVPQIGVPHGPASNPAGTPFAPAAATTAGPTPGAVQPPFAGAFPSFGTTLTAEQQNNLERRKQEEQYLMARQREFLAQQQVNMKQMQMQGGLPSALHHHSSAHSLQSQPSFGSITSPIGPIMPNQIPTTSSGFFDPPRPGQAPLGGMNMPPDFFREEEIARLTLQDRQSSFGPPGPAPRQQPQFLSQQPQVQPVGPPSQPQRQDENDPQGFRARLQEFDQLRAQLDAEQAAAAAPAAADPIGPPQSRQQPKRVVVEAPAPVEEVKKEEPKRVEEEPMSLTEQIQKAASAKPTPQPKSPWAEIPSGLPMPFPPPPPQSTTPLPAPSAQRTNSNLPDTLNAGTRSRTSSQSPDLAAAPPSIAPWAKEQVEIPKGPSLKEIQEAEAKKAAKVEEVAAAARRAALEQELRVQATAPAPGLPTTSTWAASSPVTPAATTASPWAKTSTAPVTAKAASKKTLADIQREEENRKAKAAAALAAAQPAVPIVAGGKRYADLAIKPSTSASPVAGSAWSTVGAGGKVKMPLGSASATTPTLARTSSAAVPTLARVARPSIADNRTQTSAASLATQNGATSAQAEFAKWAKSALSKGLNSDINVDDFVTMLCEFPAEAGIIADSVYANSQLMDGRRFGEEFVRRKNLADKGVVEPAIGGAPGFSTAGGNSAAVGGWSEVAKKGPPKVEEPSSVAGFRVVPNKKKGRK